MKENEQIYCVLVFVAWVVAIMAFWNIMTLEEGILGTLVVYIAAFAVWALYKDAKWA